SDVCSSDLLEDSIHVLHVSKAFAPIFNIKWKEILAAILSRSLKQGASPTLAGCDRPVLCIPVIGNCRTCQQREYQCAICTQWSALATSTSRWISIATSSAWRKSAEWTTNRAAIR